MLLTTAAQYAAAHYPRLVLSEGSDGFVLKIYAENLRVTYTNRFAELCSALSYAEEAFGVQESYWREMMNPQNLTNPPYRLIRQIGLQAGVQAYLKQNLRIHAVKLYRSHMRNPSLLIAKRNVDYIQDCMTWLGLAPARSGMDPDFIA